MPPDPPPTLTAIEVVGILGCTVVGMSVFGALALIVWLLAHPRDRS